jgi:uncharacterized protein (DUF427 family)
MPPRPLAELPPSSWPKNPRYPMDMVTVPARVTAIFNGTTVLDSERVQVMFELGHAPIYYVPREDVRTDLLHATEHATHCPYKGDASYWSLTVDGRMAENAVWGYQDPYPEMSHLKGLLGFYWDRVDRWCHDGRPSNGPVEIAGRINQSNNFAACYPELVAEWDRERNTRIQPYEYAAESDVEVWWKDAAGTSWKEPIRARVLKHVLANGS